MMALTLNLKGSKMEHILKPCPFCGSKAFEYDDEPAIECLVGCCKCSGQECMGGAIWVYIDEWNTRPLEDELVAALSRGLDYIEADEASHGRKFGIGNEFREVLNKCNH